MHILLEYMDRGSLDDIVSKTGPISETILAKIAEQVLRGLEFLHNHKIIHRDIKSSNILLNSHGEVKLCDLGTASYQDNCSPVGNFTSCKGTYFYMSPERLNGKEYGFNSDVFSLGITLAECALGRYPFKMTGCYY